MDILNINTDMSCTVDLLQMKNKKKIEQVELPR